MSFGWLPLIWFGEKVQDAETHEENYQSNQNASRGPVASQILLLGGILVAMGILSDGAYAIMAGSVGSWVKKNTGVLRAQRYFTSSVYILLGVVTAFSGTRK